MSLALHVCNVARAGKHVTPGSATLLVGAFGRRDGRIVFGFARKQHPASPTGFFPASKPRSRSCALPVAVDWFAPRPR
jgi:hypothetical protein